jgi:peptidoglycan hydrolase-like protein with peptidoglycan-binding domain
MKRTGFIIFVLAAAVCLAGCGKKEPASEEQLQDPTSMETLGTMSTTETKALPAMKPEVKVPVAAPVEPNLAPLPPSGPYKPTTSEIQTALKNAGYYDSSIDGKVGPKTKKAIQAFQKANGLEADGKVGPKTWAVLGQHLNAAAEQVKPAGKKR